MQVAFFHPDEYTQDISIVTETILKTLQENGITVGEFLKRNDIIDLKKVKFQKSWSDYYQHGILRENFFREVNNNQFGVGIER